MTRAFETATPSDRYPVLIGAVAPRRRAGRWEQMQTR
jgi:hypothetical protein